MSGTGQTRGWRKAVELIGDLTKVEAMMFLPALTLVAYWLGGERALTTMAIGLPLVLLTARSLQPAPPGARRDGLVTPAVMVAALDRVLADAPETGKTTGSFVLRIDDAGALPDRMDRPAHAELHARIAERVCDALRQGDVVARLDRNEIAVALGPVNRLELESALQLAARLQMAVTPPVPINGDRIYVTCSIGFCLAAQFTDGVPVTGRRLLEAARTAADVALRHGPSAIRAYAPDMAGSRADRDALRGELETALEDGQIRAWFQPQISTDTGAITGFEALVRWQHPVRGLIPPAEFLPAIEEAGLSERLAEVMLFNGLSALSNWDHAGLNVPTVAVNFSADELRNPRLAERIRWELDRFDLSPERLSVEILESVMADTDNDVIVANITALAKMGCGVDLDDFGTGPSSMVSLRRFSVRRIKIDRSFVTRLDEDRSQQDMVAAILSMAERLGIEALAEGVETPGEHAILAQLGCQHVQGFGVARPMPLEDTTDWITRHRSRVTATRREGLRL